MILPTLVPGFITATNQTAAGPASTVRFTIQYDSPHGPISIANVKSYSPKPPDAIDVDTRAYTNAGNNFVIGYMHPDTVIRWAIPLFPDYLVCEEAS
jgi:hypothetical protein